ncbi:VOC family protein [Streptomyces sp. WI04-05B]|uniref:VOC family protein n=1 Tax=Streptomyces TaxID=1883 RepID=UPI0029B36617|nr:MULTISPECIES: VOC family protein [unclassified Streptomyces]MDX2541569.1 VOC family protein [Streptomyces sp. WI04-05B]MDX2583697.1 VOC family protein [Streptomyces sp. WI04-05A]MDX3745482.1 VOC family protein [Streptomyces sp. AK08-02]
MRGEDQFHLGIVVEDFEGTLTALSAAFGYEWCAEIAGPLTMTLPTGEAEVRLACVYSRTEPRLEILRSVPGTLWEAGPAGGVHHVGYWSDDVGADRAELAGLGYTVEASRIGSAGSDFAFLRGPGGVLVELVDRATRPMLERFWADGGSRT